eukprot:Gb_25710 [translate_table: standard]
MHSICHRAVFTKKLLVDVIYVMPEIKFVPYSYIAENRSLILHLSVLSTTMKMRSFPKVDRCYGSSKFQLGFLLLCTVPDVLHVHDDVLGDALTDGLTSRQEQKPGLLSQFDRAASVVFRKFSS